MIRKRCGIIKLMDSSSTAQAHCIVPLESLREMEVGLIVEANLNISCKKQSLIPAVARTCNPSCGECHLGCSWNFPSPSASRPTILEAKVSGNARKDASAASFASVAANALVATNSSKNPRHLLDRRRSNSQVGECAL